MRIARFRRPDTPAPGAGQTGLVDGDTVIPVGGDPVAVAVAAASGARPEAAGEPMALGDVELLAPVARPPKFLAIGLNYRDHIAETGMPAPDFPVFFNKQSTCVVGPGEPVVVPSVSPMVDYEGELGVVIGRRCRHVPASRAGEVIAGYTVVNDVTVRDWQAKAPTMTIGKSFDTHGPLGPWLVTPDEVADPLDLRIRTWVNDELLQDASTAEMIFTIAEQIETLTTSFTLEPGDVLATGTPAGVGFVRQPPRYLAPGDTVRIEVEGIGTLENPVVAEESSQPVIHP